MLYFTKVRETGFWSDSFTAKTERGAKMIATRDYLVDRRHGTALYQRLEGEDVPVAFFENGKWRKI